MTNPKTGDSISSMLANALAGNRNARLILQLGLGGGAVIPLVPINEDACDRFASAGGGTCTTVSPLGPNVAWAGGGARTLNQLVTDEQEALLGCGASWGTDCEADGIDFAKANASVLIQSWPGVEGDYGPFSSFDALAGYCIGCLDPNGDLFPVPGTTSFAASAVPNVTGSLANSNPAYNPNLDGSSTGLTVPAYNDAARGISNGFGSATGVPFRSEMAAISWNALMTLVVLSIPVDPQNPAGDEFSSVDPARTGPGLCSFRQPQYCRAVGYLEVPEPASAVNGVAAWFGLAVLVRFVARSRFPRRPLFAE